MSRARNLHPETLGLRLGSIAEVEKARKRRRQSARAAKERKSKSSPASPRSRRSSAPTGRHHPERVRGRVGWIALLLAVGAVGVVARAADLQIRRHEGYRSAAERQASSVQTVRARRGPIVDRHGAELAISVEVDSVFAEPRHVADPAAAARQLGPVLDLPLEDLRRRLDTDRAFTYLARRVDPEVGAKVRALHIRGVSTHPEPRRFYPNRGLAAHTLGFTNIDEDGRAGLERAFDEDLHGGTVTVSALRDALGKRVMTDGFVPPSSLRGQGVRLTLDRQVQYVTESVLAETVQEFEARAGVAIVLEVGTGDVVSLASFPTFNPNNLTGSTPDHHLNRAVSAVYEPGSTLKMMTIAAALEEKIFQPTSRLDCENGRWEVGGRTIHDTHAEEGTLSIADVLRVSSNVCTAKVGMEVGKARMDRWLRRFGFGDVTGIELPGELDGLIRPVESWRDIALANIAFGQGIAVTPLQLAQATAVIAQDGLLVRPRIVRSIIRRDGTEEPVARPAPERVLSKPTARALRRMLAAVVGPEGTASRAAIEGISVAGKTGTAQKIDPVTRGYSHEMYVSSFVGMVPADAPELVILVLVDEPQGAIYGGLVAAPAFRRIAQAALTARGQFVGPAPVAPPPELELAAAELPSAVDAGMREREDLQSPQSKLPPLEAALSSEARALLGSAPSKPEPSSSASGSMPDLRGLELREVLERCAEVRCRPRFEGAGRVVEQRPTPGARIEPNSVWRVVARTSGGTP